MTAPAPVAGAQAAPGLSRTDFADQISRLIARWVFIAAMTYLAFHDSFYSMGLTSHNGGLGGFAWTVPMVAILVAIGVARRRRTELPIHDRQLDIIIGTMGLVLALLIHAVLLHRYALYFHLLRLDLLAMWLFVLSSAIVLFGLRPVFRFAWVWGMVFLIFTLPYHIFVIALGGGNFAAGAATLLVAGVGSGIAAGTTLRRGLIASLLAWAVGFAVLTVINIRHPYAKPWVFQQIPTVTAVAVVGILMYLFARRGKRKRLLDRKIEPIAARQVWAGLPLVAAVALALSLVHLPTDVSTAPIDRASPGPLAPGQRLVPPPGWTTSREPEYLDVSRLYGPDAVLVRQWMAAEVGDRRFDKHARPRTVVVDSVVTNRPFSFGVYPARVLYTLTEARFSEVRPVDLGMGVQGTMLSVIDDELLVTWTSIQFAWGDDRIAQRVTVFAVDNHDPGAPFPEPSADMFATLRTLLTLLFRGNAVLDARAASFKDADLLTEFGRSLVRAQFTTPPKASA